MRAQGFRRRLLVLAMMFLARCGPGAPPAGYPTFSWDTVPLFHHAGKWAATYTDEEIALLADHFALVVIEKHHAQRDPNYAGRLEAAIFHDAARIKARNPAVKVLFYFNAFVDNVPTSWRAAAGPAPAWLFRDEQGELIYKHRPNLKLAQFDITRPEMMAWWLDSVGRAVDHSAIDGIFIDALVQVVHVSDAKLALWGRGRYDAMARACSDLLRQTEAHLPPDAIVINNGLFGNLPGLEDHGLGWLEHASGAMVEHFGAFRSRNEDGTLRPAEMAREIELIQEAGARGKIVLVKAWPGDLNFLNPTYRDWTRDQKSALAAAKLEFALAAFLVAAEPYAYFGYSWGWSNTEGWFDWHDAFERPLGPPQGPACRDGWVFTRRFEHADVRIDLEHETARIDWHVPDAAGQ